MDTSELPQHHYEFAEDAPLPLADMRTWVRACLLGQPHAIVVDAMLLVTELASNAYEHGGGTVGLRLSFPPRSGTARFEVDDTCDRVPPRSPTRCPEAARGLGMVLVDELSTTWGVIRRTRNKTVWAELALA